MVRKFTGGETSKDGHVTSQGSYLFRHQPKLIELWVLPIPLSLMGEIWKYALAYSDPRHSSPQHLLHCKHVSLKYRVSC